MTSTYVVMVDYLRSLKEEPIHFHSRLCLKRCFHCSDIHRKRKEGEERRRLGILIMQRSFCSH